MRTYSNAQMLEYEHRNGHKIDLLLINCTKWAVSVSHVSGKPIAYRIDENPTYIAQQSGRAARLDGRDPRIGETLKSGSLLYLKPEGGMRVEIPLAELHPLMQAIESGCQP